MSGILNNLITTAYAQFPGGGTGGVTTACGSAAGNTKLSSPLGFFKPLCPITSDMSLGALVDHIITYILYAAGILAVVYLLYAGIQYITAGGDDTKATAARKGIVNAVIGIVIIVLAFVIEKAAAGIFT